MLPTASKLFDTLQSGQIRLLLIQPGNGHQVICNLETVTLSSSALKYEALSYTWGDPSLTHSATINGVSYPIASNLDGALKRLRHNDGTTRTVWIDAICINQLNIYEQTQQVNMMADIYRNASLVIMWLGEETVFDGVSVESIAFDLLRQLQDIFEEHGSVDFDFQQTGPSGLPCPGYGLPNTGAKAWIALARLFSKPYFERIWIIQEVVMATKAVVVCGKLSIGWEAVRNFARSLQKGGSIGNLEYSGAAPGIISVNVMADLKEGGGIDLLPLLVKTRVYQATKEVDKVFALINLSSNPSDVGIKVDYSMEKEPHNVWEKLALHSLMIHQSLMCLSNAGLGSSLHQSWIPNWGHRGEIRACLALYGQNNFRASGDTRASISVTKDLQTLTVSGYIVDSIVEVAPEVHSFTPVSMKSGPLGNWMSDEEEAERNTKMGAKLLGCLEPAKSAFKYAEGYTRDRELARTLCCDMIMTGEKLDVDSAYKVHRWVATVMQAHTSRPAPEEIEKLEALQRELEAAKPQGVLLEQFMNSWDSFGQGRSVCATASGDLGGVPFGTKPGDVVCVLKGGIVPYLLRAEGTSYRLVGECFINGIMYGEVLKGPNLVEKELSII